MKLPFTIQQFLEVFHKYNNSVYPLQILFVLLAALTILIGYRGGKKYQKYILFILAALWFWMGAEVPLLWSAIGSSAAFSLGIYEDTALIISAFAFVVLYFQKRKSPQR